MKNEFRVDVYLKSPDPKKDTLIGSFKMDGDPYDQKTENAAVDEVMKKYGKDGWDVIQLWQEAELPDDKDSCAQVISRA